MTPATAEMLKKKKRGGGAEEREAESNSHWKHITD